MVHLGPLNNEKSSYMKLMEWLYDNGYERIHNEWFTELGKRQPPELPPDEWLQEHYPDIWSEYVAPHR